LHTIIVDGVYAPGRPHLEKLLNRIISRVMHRLVKSGLIIAGQEQPWLDLHGTDT
jgi:hypothetical protein|tara:strand:+ start:244 stop:408 length:165 start_codon:yes stop_codon:yes gene_type:complete